MRVREVLSLSNTYSNLRGRERGSGGTGRLVIVGSPTESVLRLPSRISSLKDET